LVAWVSDKILTCVLVVFAVKLTVSSTLLQVFCIDFYIVG
jgi:hypothetical protein